MGRSNLFNRGYEKANKEIDKIEQERKKREGRLWRLFLKRDGDEVDIRFLTEEPISFYEHTVKKGNKFENIICTGEDCPLCEDDNPSFKGAYLVWDYTEYTDRNKKKHKWGKNTAGNRKNQERGILLSGIGETDAADKKLGSAEGKIDDDGIIVCRNFSHRC